MPHDARAVFEVLRDPQGHVAIDSSGMLQKAFGPRIRGVGGSFEVRMSGAASDEVDYDEDYTVRVIITSFEWDAHIAWTVFGRIEPQLGHRFGYLLEALSDTDTVVTAYYDWSTADPHWLARGMFPVLSEGTLRNTLAILERTVGRGYPRGAGLGA